MKYFSILLFIFSMLLSCQQATQETKKREHIKPLVDISNAEETVAYLCDLFNQMNDSTLSDEAYEEIQIRVEAIYLGIQFGLNAGFYTQEELTAIANAQHCLM